MNKLNILKVIDVYGWAYDFVDREQQKYSRHNIIIKKLFDLDINQINSNIDVIYFHAPNIENRVETNIINQINRNKVKIIGGYGGETNALYPAADLIISISFPFVNILKEKYQVPVIFLPESIDVNYWNVSRIFSKDSFIPGYAGKIHSAIKRPHLLDQLDYKIYKQTAWGNSFFVKNRNQQHMLDFYKNIDVLLILSKTECMPRVALEAMACGLPIISTDVGCMKMLLNKNWIVPNQSDQTIIFETNKKLKQLENFVLRKKTGESNKQRVHRFFNWQYNASLWDDVFELLYLNDIKQINNIVENYITPFKTLYDYE